LLDDEGTEVDLQSQGRSQGTALDNDGVVARVPLVHMPDGSKRAVVAKHDFVSALRRMTVIVKAENESSGRTYTKGAPEAVLPLCNAASLPNDYVSTLDHYTHRGFRVLAIAGKELPSLSWADARRMERSSVESGLTFLGLIIFENKLKAGSHAALDSLHQAGIPTKICTGDNPLTAIAVAREAEVIPNGAPVFAARISGASGEDAKGAAQGELEWIDVNSEQDTLDPYSLRPRSKALRLADCGLAMTGETFAHLLQHGAQETIERALVHAQIFARFSPEQKQQLCEQLQALQYTVAFTGDGANDCGALRAADVGLSLSEAEAVSVRTGARHPEETRSDPAALQSVAAPFTSRDEDIECISHLLREGRNSITTSFNLFSWVSA
jgi:cation-transporting ATPase 13A3/4/5